METVVQTPTDVKSPFTGGRAVLVRTRSTLPYKGEQYQVITEAYRCEDTSEEFTSIEQEDAAMLQVRALHRERTLNGALKMLSGALNQARDDSGAGSGSVTGYVESSFGSQDSLGSTTGYQLRSDNSQSVHEQAQSSFEHWRNSADSPQPAE